MQANHHSAPHGPGRAIVSRWKPSLRLVLLGASLLFVTSQMTCAEVANFWDDDNRPQTGKDGGDVDAGDGMWRCFMGTPSKEDELLNRCTEAERIDRPSSIPTATWDGKSPLPFQ